jgi:hypothetical protein
MSGAANSGDDAPNVIVGSTGAGKTLLAQRLVKSALRGANEAARFIVYTVWPGDWATGLGAAATVVPLDGDALLQSGIWPVAVVGVEQNSQKEPKEVAAIVTRQLEEAPTFDGRLHVIVDDAWWFVSHGDPPTSCVPQIVDACLPILANNGTLTLLIQTGLDLGPREVAMTSAVITVNTDSYSDRLVSEEFGIPEELLRNYHYLRRR